MKYYIESENEIEKYPVEIVYKHREKRLFLAEISLDFFGKRKRLVATPFVWYALKYPVKSTLAEPMVGEWYVNDFRPCYMAFKEK